MKTIFKLFLEGIGITLFAIILAILNIKAAIFIGVMITIVRILKNTKKVGKELIRKKRWCKDCGQFTTKRKTRYI